jgi:hypothetical protein
MSTTTIAVGFRDGDLGGDLERRGVNHVQLANVEERHQQRLRIPRQGHSLG